MGNKVNIINRKAKFNYELLSKYIAGVVLTGSEIKSIRQNKASISESFCKFDNKLNPSIWLFLQFLRPGCRWTPARGQCSPHGPIPLEGQAQ